MTLYSIECGQYYVGKSRMPLSPVNNVLNIRLEYRKFLPSNRAFKAKYHLFLLADGVLRTFLCFCGHVPFSSAKFYLVFHDSCRRDGKIVPGQVMET
jgi:hypothetical protein